MVAPLAPTFSSANMNASLMVKSSPGTGLTR